MPPSLRPLSSLIHAPIHHPSPCLHRSFHTTNPLFDSPGEKNYYDILQIPQSAAPAEIKRQFYKLSKLSHPDLHPDDPTAPSRFNDLSTAYQTLSSPSLRAKYDRTLPGASESGSRRAGSYSSASNTTAGGRSPSGLSRRRGQFRGAPASWYAAWAATGQRPPHEHAAGSSSSSSSSHSSSSSFDPNSHTGSSPFDDDQDTNSNHDPNNPSSYTTSDPYSPHFDRASHNKTHESLRSRVENKYRERRRQEAEEALERDRQLWISVGMRFLGICAVVGTGWTVAGVVTGGLSPRGEKGTDSDGRKKGEG